MSFTASLIMNMGMLFSHIHRGPSYFTAILVAVFSLAGVLYSDALAGVVVYDRVTATDRAVTLKAFTKGRFFAEGGKLVTFYLSDAPIGTTLSGGDGYAYLKYTPSITGIEKLEVKSNGDTDEGALLVTAKDDRLLIIAVEDVLFKSLFSMKPDEAGKKALTRLSKRFRIIYVTTLMGSGRVRTLLKEHTFPVSTVLQWDGDAMLANLKNQGINLYAIIASSGLLSQVSSVDKKFSFEKVDGAVKVKDWDELSQKLQD
jgi:hypothetical protein